VVAQGQARVLLQEERGRGPLVWVLERELPAGVRVAQEQRGEVRERAPRADVLQPHLLPPVLYGLPLRGELPLRGQKFRLKQS